jgi:TonB family protein
MIREILVLGSVALALISSGGAMAEKRIYTAKDKGVVPPKATTRVKVEYDPAAKAEKVEGAVKLLAVVSATGKPEEITVAESLDRRLDAKAIAAARQWRFEPAKLNGVAVAFRVMLQLNFRLDEKVPPASSR